MVEMDAKSNGSGMSRREFLAGAAASALGLTVAGCAVDGSIAIRRRPFGRTRHRSTRIIFGAYALSSVTDPDKVDATLAALDEYGINHIDTAPSYGGSHVWVGKWMKDHRDRFFLATKTDRWTYDGAMRQVEASLRALQTDHVDLLQLHNLVNPLEWETAMGEDGALKALVEARDQGLTRFVGVTGHGVTVAAMHIESLSRYDFDSVLLPWNYPMAQNRQYASDFENLLAMCEERNVAVQIIKSIAHGGSVAGASRSYNTWYRPLEDQSAIDMAVHWVLDRKEVFLITSGDMDLLPRILDAGSRFRSAPSDNDMEKMAADQGMQPLFT